MANTALALLKHLSSPVSPLPELTSGYTRPSTVFFSLAGFFWIYSFKTAKVMYTTLLVATVSFICLRKSSRVWKEQLQGGLRVLGGIVGALVGANGVAVVMDKLLGKGMSWFSREYSPLLLYAPPALFGSSLTPFCLR
jgi:hypothetical protein